MRLNFKNHELIPVQKFLYNLTLKKAKPSRSRSKLVKKLDEKIKEYQEDVQDLINLHSEKDENGEPVVHEGGGYRIVNRPNFDKDQEELNNEEVVIECGEYANNFTVLYNTVNEIEDIELSGQEAEGYDIFLDRFEEE